MKQTKCKLKQCLNYEKQGRTGYCFINIVPTLIKQLQPNDIKCPFFGTSFEEELKWLRQQGGMINVIMHQKGKKTLFELKEMKGKRKRKPRSDKGKKRGKKKKDV